MDRYPGGTQRVPGRFAYLLSRIRLLFDVGFSLRLERYRWTGISTVKVEPLPGSLSTEMDPPKESTKPLTIGSPSPVPVRKRVFFVFDPIEAVKNFPQIFGFNAEPIILDGDADIVTDLVHLDGNLTVLLGVVDGVRNQVAHNALEGQGVGREGR